MRGFRNGITSPSARLDHHPSYLHQVEGQLSDRVSDALTVRFVDDRLGDLRQAAFSAVMSAMSNPEFVASQTKAETGNRLVPVVRYFYIPSCPSVNPFGIHGTSPSSS